MAAFKHPRRNRPGKLPDRQRAAGRQCPFGAPPRHRPVPVITFRSDGIDGPVLTGELTVRNIIMPVTLAIEPSAVTPRTFSVRARTRIDRNEFGVSAYRGLAARYLDMTAEVRCVRT
jgi:YceI-like domain